MKTLFTFITLMVAGSAFAQTNGVSTNLPPPTYSFVYALPATPPEPTNLFQTARYLTSTNAADPTQDTSTNNVLPTGYVWFPATTWEALCISSNQQFWASSWAANPINPFNATVAATNKLTDFQALTNKFYQVTQIDRPSLVASNASNAQLNGIVLDICRLLNKLQPVIMNDYTNGYNSGLNGQ